MSKDHGCELPEDLYYDLDYVWLRRKRDGTLVIGVTDPAQAIAGRLQNAHIRKVGTHLNAKRHVATLESSKWVGGVPVPFSGTVIARNEALLVDPHLINIDPYGEAWIAQVMPDDSQHALDHVKTGSEAIKELEIWIKRYDVQCMRCTD